MQNILFSYKTTLLMESRERDVDIDIKRDNGEKYEERKRERELAGEEKEEICIDINYVNV